MSKCKLENKKLKINNFLPLQWRGKNFLATSELRNSGEGLSFSKTTQLPLLTGEGRGEVATRRVPICERSEQNNFPFSTFNFPFKGGELC